MAEAADGRKQYTPDLAEVIEAEREYLAERRERNGLPPPGDDAPLWGLAFSGGGVRSATFCLGAIQALTRSGVMKRFDYLSTVSGGGYIGSCLSSLLTDNDDTGLDNDDSPFTGLREDDDYTDPQHTKLSVRHQIHHLRTHGEYLIPRSRLMSRDVQRAVGSVLPGTLHTVLLFLLLFVAIVASVHLVLTGIDGDLTTLAPTSKLHIPGEAKLSTLEYVKAVPGVWYRERIRPPVSATWRQARPYWLPLLGIAVIGAAWSAGAVARATRLARSFDPTRDLPTGTTRAGWTPEDERESSFVRRFNVWSVVAGIVLMIGFAILCRSADQPDACLGALTVPLAFALGGLVTSQGLTHWLQSSFARRAWDLGGGVKESRFRRSLYATLRGACIYGVAAAVLVPALLVLLFALSGMPWKFFWSLIALAVSYAASRGGGTRALQLGGWLQRPLANIALLLFLGFAFAQVSALLLTRYRTMNPDHTWLYSVVVGCAALALFILLGVVVDANRISPHYFYRDRLTEAYLKTDARTRRPDDDRQGMPLAVVRDDEDLKLCDLGTGNGRGPYHLIVAAMNLAGSNELNRKSFLSEHFIFSRDYVGSRVTGWVDTSLYRGGSTRLARAMAISAAAVGSGMGPNTFAAQAFVTTLLNARLGFWTENPWYYRHQAPSVPRSGLTFWPTYLLLEALGKATAQRPRVNVSDGGHTGDNVGLLPLLQRRCRTIVVCDAEADGELAFPSFNNAVRMALTEENIGIEIDLTPIMDREETTAGFEASAANVVVGTITYPDGGPGGAPSTGRLVYVKASIPRTDCPVHVANYAKAHQPFPHETTADQFFDDAQFEAYRALGESLAGVAAGELAGKSP